MRASTALPANLRPAAGLCFSCVKQHSFFIVCFYYKTNFVYTQHTRYRAYNFYLKLLSLVSIPQSATRRTFCKEPYPGITLSYNLVPPRTRFPFRPVDMAGYAEGQIIVEKRNAGNASLISSTHAAFSSSRSAGGRPGEGRRHLTRPESYPGSLPAWRRWPPSLLLRSVTFLRESSFPVCTQDRLDIKHRSQCRCRRCHSSAFL